MKTLSSEILAYRQSRLGVSCQILVYITAKNRDTGEPESIGFWTGADHDVFTINSVGRTYYGAGDIIEVDDITSEVGVLIRQHIVTLSSLSEETLQAVKGYNARLAPIEIHRAEFDLDTGELIDEPERKFKGWIDTLDIDTGGKGGKGTITLTCVSVARALTRTLTLKYGDSSQKLVNPNDDFLKYADLSGSTEVFWAQKRVKTTDVAAADRPFLTRANQKVVGAI